MASVRLQADPLAHAQDLLDSGRSGDAAALLQSLLGENRGGLLARLTYARALAAHGETAAALDSARETALLYSGAAIAVLTLGEALIASGQLPTAIAELQRALRIDPDLAAARYTLGCAWLEAGEPEKALEEFTRIATEKAPSDLPEKLAEAQRMRAASRSNANYVRHLFDQFSADYDTRMLGQLGYAAPRILRELAALVLPNSKSLDVLDLGCGTGLSGLAFRDIARQMDGIDLSPAMIEHARARSIYDRLTVADIEAPICERYDLIVAADTLVYLGDLSLVLSSVFRALNSGGMLLFTTEKDSGESFSLGPKRRWRHSEKYLRNEAQRAGFALAALIEGSPRTEAGVPVDGLAVALRKP